MENANQVVKQPVRLWLRVLLGVSLALNLLVVGLVGGAILRFGGPDGMRPPPRTIGAVLYRELPKEDRRAVFAGSKRTHKERHERQKADAQAVSAAVRATPFDAVELAAVLDRQAARRTGFQKSVQQVWLTRVGAMSEAERLAYADRLERALNRRWGRDRRN